MSQIFPRSANSYARGSIIALVILSGVLFLTLDSLSRSPYVTRANTVREQPVQFSHQHHAGRHRHRLPLLPHHRRDVRVRRHPADQDLHELPLADLADQPRISRPVRASFRDDKPLQWTRVHDLPDFVYFNHSVHVSKGVGCATCHGRVDRMPLMYQAGDAADGVVPRLPPPSREVRQAT